MNRRLIGRNLYAITPCLRQMLSLWQTTYTKLSFVNADALLSHAGAFDLVEFIVSNHQECQNQVACASERERERGEREQYVCNVVHKRSSFIRLLARALFMNH